MKTGKYMKKSPVKGIALALVLVLLLGCGIGGTLAWLSATSGTVTNTFTVGKITIELKEHELQADGTLKKTTEGEVVENENYKIVPGATQPKDPFVRVGAGSENCYVYVCIENQLGTNATYNIDPTDWREVGKSDNKVLYRYKDPIDASAAAVTETVFTSVTYSDDITETTITALDGKQIILSAFAHQSENTALDTADAAALNHFNVTKTPNP